MKFFLCVLGMVMIVEGLPYFAAPEKMKYWVQKVVATPDSALRRLGLAKGFVEVVAGPLVRSSYRAERALEGNNAGRCIGGDPECSKISYGWVFVLRPHLCCRKLSSV